MPVRSYIRGTICKYENSTLKVTRNAFNIGEVWNPVCCHGNKTFKLALWSTFTKTLLQRIKRFCYKLAEIERFSFDCRKVIGFAFTTLHDWLKRFTPLFHPIRSKTGTNCVTLACIFPRFASATCNYFEF